MKTRTYSNILYNALMELGEDDIEYCSLSVDEVDEQLHSEKSFVTWTKNWVLLFRSSTLTAVGRHPSEGSPKVFTHVFPPEVFKDCLEKFESENRQ